MAVVNVATVLNKVATKLTGGLPRASLLAWFNEVVRDILSQPRTWAFLSEPVTLPIVDNQITLPAGMSELISIQIGPSAFFTRTNNLTAKEAFEADAAGGAQPVGYTFNATNVITFHPAAAAGDATVTGENTVIGDYADGDNTVFPLDVFENLFIAGVLEKAFYVDKDGRFGAENMKYQLEMNKAKKWDNLRKASPRLEQHGYIRT